MYSLVQIWHAPASSECMHVSDMYPLLQVGVGLRILDAGAASAADVYYRTRAEAMLVMPRQYQSSPNQQ